MQATQEYCLQVLDKPRQVIGTNSSILYGENVSSTVNQQLASFQQVSEQSTYHEIIDESTYQEVEDQESTYQEVTAHAEFHSSQKTPDENVTTKLQIILKRCVKYCVL